MSVTEEDTHRLQFNTQFFFFAILMILYQISFCFVYHCMHYFIFMHVLVTHILIDPYIN